MAGLLSVSTNVWRGGGEVVRVVESKGDMYISVWFLEVMRVGVKVKGSGWETI